MTDQHDNNEMARQKLERPIHPEADLAHLGALTVWGETDQVLTITRHTHIHSVPAKSRCSGRKHLHSWLLPLFPSVDLIIQGGYWNIQLIRLSDTVQITEYPTFTAISFSLGSYKANSFFLIFLFVYVLFSCFVADNLMFHDPDPFQSAISIIYSPNLNMPNVPQTSFFSSSSLPTSF